MKYYEELKMLRLANDMLRPEDVVEYARDETTNLHGKFDWNDSVAAEKWRYFQAQTLAAFWNRGRVTL
jgi:hypothetical protein